MKNRSRTLYLILAAGVSLFFSGCAAQNSKEACRHEVTANLDRGDFNAVVSSPCADSMQKGAAWFGMAGFSIGKVVNRFIETDTETTTATNQTIETNPLTTFMNSLVGTVASTSLGHLDKAGAEYETVIRSPVPEADASRDAHLYLGLVHAVKSLSLLKMTLDTTGSGFLNNACDMNGNDSPDEVDAAVCALEQSSGQTCTAGVGIILDDKPITISSAGVYRGLIIQVDGRGKNTKGCPGPNQYRKLLYERTASVWAVVTAEFGPPACQGIDNQKWPCPILDPSGNPLDLVSAFDASLIKALASLGGSLTTPTNVLSAVQDIRFQACPTGSCTSQDLASYLQTIQTIRQ